nr:hypothetical protein [Tanacetum cinerariifolium]
MIFCFVSKGLGHRIEKAKEAGQKETDIILDCLKNAKERIDPFQPTVGMFTQPALLSPDSGPIHQFEGYDS